MDETPGGIVHTRDGGLVPATRRTGMAGLLGLLMASAAGVAGAAIGDLDPTFGDHGRVSLAQYSLADVLDRAADGKLLFQFAPNGSDAPRPGSAVGRLNADGALDNGFADQGIASLEFPGPDTMYVRRGRLVASGKILLVGAAGGSRPMRVAAVRLNADGSRDAGFGVGGLARIELPTTTADLATDFALLPDGKIMLAGYRQDAAGHDFMLLRLLPDGQLDASFGDGGARTYPDPEGSESDVRLFRQSDGKLVLCGGRSTTSTSVRTRVMRVDATGQPDPGFGDGVMGSLVDGGGSCLLRSDGRILVYGTALSSGSFATVRQLTSVGTLDESFGNAGGLALTLDCSESHPCDTAWFYEGVSDAVELDDGSIALAALPGITRMVAVARLRPDGLIDPDFGQGGYLDLDLGDSANTGHLFTDGSLKLLVTGTGEYNALVGRINLAEDPGATVLGIASWTSAHEGDGTTQVSVRRTGSAEGTVSVDYLTENLDQAEARAGQDYQAVSGTLTWADGDVSPKIISVPIVDDVDNEPAESFRVRLSNSVGAGFAREEVILTIQASDAPVPAPGSGGGGGGGGSGGGGGGAVEPAWIAWATLLLLLGSRRRPPARP